MSARVHRWVPCLVCIVVQTACQAPEVLPLLPREPAAPLPLEYQRLARVTPARVPLFSELVRGRARVIDGDTIAIGDTVIRLEGLDAPELEQHCEGPPAIAACGAVAANFLATRVTGLEVTCGVMGADAYDRRLARCEAGGEELSRVMVQGGLAFAFARHSDRLVPEEREARAARRGIWQGTGVEAPWDYRAARW